MKKGDFLPRRFDISDAFYDARLLENIGSGKTHWHSHFLVSVFVRGKGVQHLNNKKYEFEPGTAILLSPFDFHYNETSETFDAYSIKFTYKVFNSRLYEKLHLGQFPIVTKLSERDFEASKAICRFLTEEKSMGADSDEMLIEGMLEQLVLLVLRNNKSESFGQKSDSSIIKALIYIHDNFKENISASDVAGVCHYTPNYFSSCFKKETGVTFRKYLHDLRLEYAFNMINYGNKSCSEACFESGFNSVEYFSSAFKEKYGHSPKFYIKS